MEQLTEFDGEYYTLRLKKQVAIIQLTKDIFEIGTNLALKDSFFSLFDTVAGSSDIRAILLTNSPGVLSDKEYRSFIKNAVEARSGETKKTTSTPWLQIGQLSERQENTLSQFILKAVSLPKALIFGLQGDIATPFFGASLTGDYRFVSEDMAYSPSHVRLGIPPSGALGFFLPRFIGQGRATDILLSEQSITAIDAQQMGLVSNIFPADKFVDSCVDATCRMSEISLNTIKNTKATIYYYAKELEIYLEREYEIMWRALTHLEAD